MVLTDPAAISGASAELTARFKLSASSEGSRYLQVNRMHTGRDVVQRVSLEPMCVWTVNKKIEPI